MEFIVDSRRQSFLRFCFRFCFFFGCCTFTSGKERKRTTKAISLSLSFFLSFSSSAGKPEAGRGRSLGVPPPHSTHPWPLPLVSKISFGGKKKKGRRLSAPSSGGRANHVPHAHTTTKTIPGKGKERIEIEKKEMKSKAPTRGRKK